ncbi:MAG: ATP-dependent DNA helicase RecG, partial [Rhizobiaceae bacterium]|nr:ATP-dependent DNA helicase RecG [Rhizobiaceae bacterium]
MRPTILDPLFAAVTTIEGVGPKVAGFLKTLLLPSGADVALRVRDLLFHLPTGLVDRRRRGEVATVPEGTIATLTVRIDRHQPPPRDARHMPYRVFAQDETGEIALTYFRAQSGWMEKLLPPGETMLVSGKVEWFNGRPQMVHPDFVCPIAEAEGLPLVEPVYPLTAGLTPKVLRKAVAGALAEVPDLPEWIDPAVVAREAFPRFQAALKRLHDPTDAADLDPVGAFWKRLAYDEFLAGQLALALSRQRLRQTKGRQLVGD